MDGNAEQGIRGEAAEEHGIPREAGLPPPRAAHAPDERLRLENPPALQICDAPEPRGVRAAQLAQRRLGLHAEQPGGRDESRRLDAELPEIRARPFHQSRGSGAVEIIELTLVRCVDARGQFCAHALTVPPSALVVVAVHDQLVPRRRLRTQPHAARCVREKMPAPVMIRDDEQRAARHAERGQFGEDFHARRLRLRRDVVERDDQRTSDHRARAARGRRRSRVESGASVTVASRWQNRRASSTPIVAVQRGAARVFSIAEIVSRLSLFSPACWKTTSPSALRTVMTFECENCPRASRW